MAEGKSVQSSKSKQAQKAPASSTRVSTDAKTGNMITANTNMPSRSLDVVQSKEVDGENNEYWKTVNK